MSHDDPTKTDAPLTRSEWTLLIVLCGALFLDALDISMIQVALPAIRTDLGMTTGAPQWVISGYVLGYGGFLLFGRRAADLLGRRRVFVAALAVFLLASGLGGLAQDGSVLIATRFIKGVSAAFTAPAGLSIITTSFAEGPARNRALALYTATGAGGFSLGLVFGGVLTEAGWLDVRAAGRRRARDPARRPADAAGRPAAGLLRGPLRCRRRDKHTAAVLLFVVALVEAPVTGWASVRTLGFLVGACALLAAFVALERRSPAPLVRLGMLRSGPLVQANIGAMALFGAWVGFLFVATLYLRQLRGWSALQTGWAIFPSGVVVVALAPRISGLVSRHGTTRLIAAGLSSSVVAYLLFLRIDANSSFLLGVLPTVLLGGLGFVLAYGPLNIAATNGIAPREQGLASGLVGTSFQFGGALVLALVTAAISAAGDGSAHGTLDGFHAGIAVSVAVAVLGLTATVLCRRPRRAHDA